MLRPADIRAKAERKYPDVLKAMVAGESIFPLRIRFGKPSPTDDFAGLKAETEALVNGNFGYTIESEERNTRRWGTQPLVSQIRFDTEQQFVKALGKEREVQRFKQNVATAKARFPALDSWLTAYVRWVVEYADDWEGILKVCEFFLANPRPGVYIRQLPIPVHTKFIQEHSEVLTSMLMTILPEQDRNREGKSFEERFGLKPVEHTIRFRALDPSIVARFALTDERMGLPRDRFRALPAEGICVIITENLMNLECLPAVSNGIGIWGQGRAVELLTRVSWLNRCTVFYWGDIDEHGLQILGGLRSTYPDIRSVMMDLCTLNDLRTLCGKGGKAGAPPKNLTAEERAAFDEVMKHDLRLEQEKIPLDYSNRKLLSLHLPKP